MEDYRSEARRRWQQNQQGAQSSDTKAAENQSPAPPKAARNARAEPAVEPIHEMLMRQWGALPEDQKTQILYVGGIMTVVLLIGKQIIYCLILALVILYLHTRLPTTASFEPFFREWFTKEYFPRVSQAIQNELKERSKRETNIFESLATNFKGWVMGKTETLQAEAWYELVIKYALPARYRDMYCMRTATVNVGSRRQPCFLTFWGVHDRWMLSPFIVLDVNNVSSVDEVNLTGSG
jgi:hypothetical protein